MFSPIAEVAGASPGESLASAHPDATRLIWFPGWTRSILERQQNRCELPMDSREPLTLFALTLALHLTKFTLKLQVFRDREVREA